jgi:hypothetical protein
MVDQRLGAIQQGFDELVEVIDLLEFASRVLVQLAVTGQDVQFLSSSIDCPGRISGMAAVEFGFFMGRNYRIQTSVEFVSTESKSCRY